MAKLLKGLCYTAAFVILAAVILAWIGAPSKEEQAQAAQDVAAIAARANIADVVLAGSESRGKIVMKLQNNHREFMEAIAASGDLNASARQIHLVEASPMATHDLDIATTLDGQRKDLTSALNRWNAEYNRPTTQQSPKSARSSRSTD
jgi:hypothetical protein